MTDWNQGPPPGGYPPQGGHPPQQGGYPPQQGYQPQGNFPSVKRVSPGLYITLYLVGLIGGGIMTGLAVSDPKLTELVAVCWLPLLIAIIAFWVLLYKAWAAIQDGYTPVSPGKALGFMFIPLFNIYWMFIGIGSWGREFNSFAERQRIVGFTASPGLFLAHCIFTLVPFGAVVTLYTGPAILIQFCRGINSVADRHAGGLPIAHVHHQR